MSVSGIRYVRLLHEAAPLHTSKLVMQFFKPEVIALPHSQTVLSLSIPCDFFLFPKLKKLLSGRCYESRQQLSQPSASASSIFFIHRTMTHFRSGFRDFKPQGKLSRDVLSIALFEINAIHITYRTALVKLL